MFENIIGQDAVVDDLKGSLERDELPGSLLFHGPDYSGKLSTALELARGLTCRGAHKAVWGCTCSSCKSHRTLNQPYTIMVGGRYFQDEIEASAATFLRSPQPACRYLFIRSVRKLIRRFDPVFWDDKDATVKKVQSALADLDERLNKLNPEKELPSEAVLKKEVDKIVQLAGTVSAVRAVDNISIDQIRRLSVWAHGTSDSRKIIILENADRMLESARNALLKILEEPPPMTTFILLTGRKGGIIPTILSRVRQYSFIERTSHVSMDILKRIFREESGEYDSLRDFFLAWNINLESIRKGAGIFLEGLEGREPLNRTNLDSLFGKGKDNKKIFRVFLQEIQAFLGRRFTPEELFSDPSRGKQLAAWNDLFREALVGAEIYNQNPSLLAEGLYYKMRGI
ncbi:MAG: hypothetical protein JEY99_10360 [Spirochaetales bacterium]|nr:hypothetical protein [Spirochaetales bacterium]